MLPTQERYRAGVRGPGMPTTAFHTLRSAISPRPREVLRRLRILKGWEELVLHGRASPT
jgi:hypothetical protein